MTGEDHFRHLIEQGYSGVVQVHQPHGAQLADAMMWCMTFDRDALPAAELDGWVDARLARLVEHGAEPDGWSVHMDADEVVYRLLVRLVAIPSVV